MEGAKADTSYDIRSLTGDKISATVFVPATQTYAVGKVKQGSFGAPSINDKGTVGYACILSGAGLSSTRNNSVIVRLKGQKPARIAVQAGNVVADSFLPPVLTGNSFPNPGSGKMYRIGINVALNNKNRAAFTGQLLYELVNPGTPPTITDSDTAVYGVLVPSSKSAKIFTGIGLSSFLSYYDGILTEPVSLNNQTSIVYNANFFITSTKSVPGFAFRSPSNGALIATTESTVIGLSYFTTFQSFSEPIIADHNVAFVVANLSDSTAGFDGIWQGNNPDLQPVVVKNTAAPGGGRYSTFGETIGTSRNGKLVAFTATLGGGTSGVFRVNVDGSKDVKIATVGQAAPTSPGNTALGTFSTFTLAAASNSGQVAVLATIPASTNSNGNARSGIWLTDKNGENLSLVVVEGQSLKVGSTTKRVTKIAFSPISGLNTKGQVAFTATFSDRTSAVIVATL